MPEFKNIKTWTDRFGHTALRSFTDEAGPFLVGAEPGKGLEVGQAGARRSRSGLGVRWTPGGAYTGRLLIDGEIFTPKEATNRFMQQPDGSHEET